MIIERQKSFDTRREAACALWSLNRMIGKMNSAPLLIRQEGKWRTFQAVTLSVAQVSAFYNERELPPRGGRRAWEPLEGGTVVVTMMTGIPLLPRMMRLSPADVYGLCEFAAAPAIAAVFGEDLRPVYL